MSVILVKSHVKITNLLFCLEGLTGCSEDLGFYMNEKLRIINSRDHDFFHVTRVIHLLNYYLLFTHVSTNSLLT